MIPFLNRIRLALTALLSGMLLVACSGPSYKTQYYTLTADEAEVQLAAAYSGSIGVGPVRLPENLDRSGIVSRGRAQQLSVAPYDVWGGDLQLAVTRVLADDLSMYLNTHEVWPFPWDNRVRPDRQVTVVLERFGGERGGRVELQAKWRLLSSDGSRVLDSDRVHFSRQAENSSYNAYVTALNQLLHEFARELAVRAAEVAG